MKKVHIVVITSPGIQLTGIKQVVGEKAGNHAVFQTNRPSEAEYFCRLLDPKVIMLHWESLMSRARDFVRHLRRTCPGCRIVALARDRREAAEAMKARACGYVLQSAGSEPSSVVKAFNADDFSLWKSPCDPKKPDATRSVDGSSRKSSKSALPTNIPSQATAPTMAAYCGLRLDFEMRTVKKNDKPISLTYLEFRLLAYMMVRQGRIITYEELLQNVWGYKEPAGAADVVKACIYRLRRKVGMDTEGQHYISNIRKVGYMFGSH